MTQIDAVQHQEGSWRARAKAQFWEPGTEAWVRNKLWLPDDVPVTGALLDELKIRPYESNDGPVPGNKLVNGGLINLTSQLKNGSKAWSPSGASTGWVALCVGDGTTPELVIDTDVEGPSKAYRFCDVSYPDINLSANGEIVMFVTFASGEANFNWNNYGALVPGGSATAQSNTAAVTSKPAGFTLLNHKTSSLGAKSNGATATLRLTITII